MKKLLALSLLALLCVSCFAQTVTLTFTGRDANNNHCQLDDNQPDEELAGNYLLARHYFDYASWNGN